MNTCTNAVEINFDCLVGPTHHFGGLSLGNLASTKSKKRISSPKKAALQGLHKMRFLAERGFIQGILPPHERPHLKSFRNLGLSGKDHEILRSAHERFPSIFFRLCSSSAMWAANAATVSPSVDARDQRVHISPANLVTMLHRSIEHEFAHAVFKKIFADERMFAVHPALLPHDLFSDEGAANHNRLTRAHGEQGIQIFVYGKEAEQFSQPTKIFPARQSLLANIALKERHKLDDAYVFNVQQNPIAIDHGAFHNDVVCVINEHVMLCHELAFLHQQQTLKHLRERYQMHYQQTPTIIEIANDELSIDDAVTCYLFNSQLLTKPSGSMLLFAPADCLKLEKAQSVIDRILAEQNPLDEVHYFDISESMANGGGPACLRLRMVLKEHEQKAILPNILFSEQRFRALEEIISTHYVDELSADLLWDPDFLRSTHVALDKIAQVLGLGTIYEFQR